MQTTSLLRKLKVLRGTSASTGQYSPTQAGSISGDPEKTPSPGDHGMLETVLDELPAVSVDLQQFATTVFSEAELGAISMANSPWMWNSDVNQGPPPPSSSF